MDPRPLGYLCGRAADPTSVLVVLHKLGWFHDETGTGGVTPITLSAGRPPSGFHDGCYLIETTRGTGWSPACGTTIASGLGCIGGPFAVGPWPVIVTWYVPGTRSAVNRP